MNFPSKEDQDITVREAIVTTIYPGMSPRRVEDLITRPVEKYIRMIPQVEDIKDVRSTTGMSTIHVKVYDKFFNMAPIWQDLRNKMDDVKSELPQGTIGPIVNDDFGDVFAATIALTADGFSMAEMYEVAKKIRDDLYTVAGTRKVELHGVQEERIYLETTNARLARYGISPSELARTLQKQNIILPGGSIQTGLTEIIIEPTGNFQSLEDIENVIFELPSSKEVAYLKDILTVKRGYIDPPKKKAYFTGQPAIVLAVSMMEKGVNVLEFSPRVVKRIKEWQNRLPVGYKLDFATYQSDYVKESVDNVVNNLYQTLGIVLVVVMIFLGFRTGLIVGTVIPLTMLMTLVCMMLMGIELHRISLATLIISLGLLVDNGIVMAEEITRRLREGEPRKEAAINAGKTLAIPLLTSSLTTILAFVPLALAPNASGEYMSAMAKVIFITLMSSWLLANLVTPLMCYYWLKPSDITPEQAKAQYEKPIYRIYKSFLRFVIRFRLVFLLVVGGLFVGAIYLKGFIREQFFPMSSRNQYHMYLDLPAGYSSNATDTQVQRLLQWLNDKEANPEITSTIGYVGYGGPRFYLSLSPRDPQPNAAYVLVTTKDTESVDTSMNKVRTHILHYYPDIAPRIKKFWLGATETGLIEVRISGPNHEIIYTLAERVADALRSIPGTVDIYNNWENRVSKVLVNVDQARARRAGVTSEEIADSLSGYFSGGQVTDYREGDNVIPVMFRAEEDERTNMDRLRSVNVYSQSKGISVPLSQVADFKGVTQFSSIMRRNLQRNVIVSAKHLWLQAAELEQALMPELEKIMADMPKGQGYWWEFGGETYESKKSQKALFMYVPHCIGLMILLMVWQFNSYAKPFIIFIAIPLTLIGAFPGMLITGAFFGFMAVLGILSLAGIIINNAIVLLEAIQNEIDAGATPYDAVITASVTRFQPVIMTTLTTILGLLPLMFPPDPLFFAMAVVMSFGLGAGTVLTLLFVPVLYIMLFRVSIAKKINTKAGEKVK